MDPSVSSSVTFAAPDPIASPASPSLIIGASTTKPAKPVEPVKPVAIEAAKAVPPPSLGLPGITQEAQPSPALVAVRPQPPASASVSIQTDALPQPPPPPLAPAPQAPIHLDIVVLEITVKAEKVMVPPPPLALPEPLLTSEIGTSTPPPPAVTEACTSTPTKAVRSFEQQTAVSSTAVAEASTSTPTKSLTSTEQQTSVLVTAASTSPPTRLVTAREQQTLVTCTAVTEASTSTPTKVVRSFEQQTTVSSTAVTEASTSPPTKVVHSSEQQTVVTCTAVAEASTSTPKAALMDAAQQAAVTVEDAATSTPTKTSAERELQASVAQVEAFTAMPSQSVAERAQQTTAALVAEAATEMPAHEVEERAQQTAVPVAEASTSPPARTTTERETSTSETAPLVSPLPLPPLEPEVSSPTQVEKKSDLQPRALAAPSALGDSVPMVEIDVSPGSSSPRSVRRIVISLATCRPDRFDTTGGQQLLSAFQDDAPAAKAEAPDAPPPYSLLQVGGFDRSFAVRAGKLELYANRAGFLEDTQTSIELPALDAIEPVGAMLLGGEDRALFVLGRAKNAQPRAHPDESPDGTPPAAVLLHIDLDTNATRELPFAAQYGVLAIDGLYKGASLQPEGAFLALTKDNVLIVDPAAAESEAGDAGDGPVVDYYLHETPEESFGRNFTCFKASGDGMVATGSADGEIRLLQQGDDPVLVSFVGAPILAIDITFDGRWILATTARFLAIVCISDVVSALEQRPRDAVKGFFRAHLQEPYESIDGIPDGIPDSAFLAPVHPTFLRLTPEDEHEAARHGFSFRGGQFDLVTEPESTERWCVSLDRCCAYVFLLRVLLFLEATRQLSFTSA